MTVKSEDELDRILAMAERVLLTDRDLPDTNSEPSAISSFCMVLHTYRLTASLIPLPSPTQRTDPGSGAKHIRPPVPSLAR